MHEFYTPIKTKQRLLLCLAIVAAGFWQCTDCESDYNNGKESVKELIIYATDYINGTPHESVTALEYTYKNDVVSAVTNAGKKHIEFSHSDCNTVEKLYYDNLEHVFSIDSFFYDDQDRLIQMRSYNELGYLTVTKELIYDRENLTNLKETTYYPLPVPIVEEYDFTYAGLNIDSVHFVGYDQTYVCEYYLDENDQQLPFYRDVIGGYLSGIYGINAVSLPAIMSKNRIQSIRGIAASGEELFENTYEHFVQDGRYEALHFASYYQNGEPLNTTRIEFVY